jgi:DNA-binding NarL/FixJ family response regulator
MNKARIVLADDHEVLLEGLKRILESEAEVTATASDGVELLELVQKLRPDIAVVDISMPKLNGLDAFKKCKGQAPGTKFIFLTGHPDITLATEAFRAGASAYVLKHSAAEELIAAVRSVRRGQTYISPRIAGEVLQNLMNHPQADSGETATHLTVRERQVLQLLAEGKTLKEAAAVLDVSPRTVEFHRNNISDKTGLRTLAELVRYACRQGLVQDL